MTPYNDTHRNIFLESMTFLLLAGFSQIYEQYGTTVSMAIIIV